MSSQNELFPIFLKVHELDVLIVGGGNVALEKLTFLLKGSPNAKVTVVAKMFRKDIHELAADHHSVKLIERAFDEADLNGKQLAILATDNRLLHEQIKTIAKQKGILTNVADTPDLCDFYLGGVVTKGDLKIAISTNGKSPTLAKRLRQVFEEELPNDTQELIDNLNSFRKTLKDDFGHKVRTLNELTATLLSRSQDPN